jgi:hypothetical protein
MVRNKKHHTLLKCSKSKGFYGAFANIHPAEEDV